MTLETGAIKDVSSLGLAKHSLQGLQLEYLDNMSQSGLTKKPQITMVGLGESASIGGAAGALAFTGYGVAGVRIAEGISQAIRPFLGSLSYYEHTPIPLSSIAKFYGPRGLAAGALIGLLTYGGYKTWQSLHSQQNA